MKLIYIHQHFVTNEGASGTRSYDVSKHMVNAGHNIYMVTGLYDVGNFKPLPWYKLFRKEIIDGINVIFCNAPYSNKFGTIRRYWAFLWFAFLATLAALTVKKPDIVFASSTPLTVGIPGYLAARLKKVPFVFEVRDIWPESFIQSGWVTGEELSIKLMEKLEKFCYRNAQKILLVSKGFEESLIKRGVPREKIRTILLGADGSIFENIKPDYAFLDKYNLKGKKIAVFTGAHGKANGLDYVINAAEYSKHRNDIAYLLIGTGGEKEKLKDLAKSKGLTNIVFADPVSKERLVGVLAVCHIGLMILKHNPGGFRPVTPNKIFDYMFVGIPSIVNFTGPTIDMIKEDNSGVFADGTKPQELAEQVIMFVDNPAKAKQMGENGRKAALQKYDRKIIAAQLMEIFQEAIRKK